jgi:hypothetical protein
MEIATIRQRITCRSITPGAKQHSIRRHPAALTESASTVVEA